jgi:hypothetical protein
MRTARTVCCLSAVCELDNIKSSVTGKVENNGVLF